MPTQQDSSNRRVIPSPSYLLDTLPSKPDQAYTPYTPPFDIYNTPITPNAPPNTPTHPTAKVSILFPDPAKPFINPFTPYVQTRPSTQLTTEPTNETSSQVSTEPLTESRTQSPSQSTTQPSPTPPKLTFEQIIGTKNLERWDAEERAVNPVGRKEKVAFLWKKFRVLYLVVFLSFLVMASIVGGVVWLFVNAAMKSKVGK